MGNGKRILAALLVGAGVSGCSTQNVEVGNVKSAAIYQIYRATYDADQDTTVVYARFRVGGWTGTNVDLAGRGSVACNDRLLHDGVLFGALGKYYEGSVPGFPGRYEFVFTDPEGKKFKSAVQLERIGVAAATPERLSRGRDHTLRFDGPPLKPGETITLEIDQRPAGGGPNPTPNDPFADPRPPDGGPGKLPLVRVTTKTAGATELVVRRDDLAAVKNGPARLQWVRIADASPQAAFPAGGSITATYLSKKRNVTLEE